MAREYLTSVVRCVWSDTTNDNTIFEREEMPDGTMIIREKAGEEETHSFTMPTDAARLLFRDIPEDCS